MTVQCAGCHRKIDLDVNAFLKIGGKLFHNKKCNIRFNTVPPDKRSSQKQVHHLNWRYQD